MSSYWFSQHVAYTMAKYGMSMCVLGMAEEFKGDGISVNALWPRTSIATAAIELIAGKAANDYSRTVDIMADAAYVVLSKDPKQSTGQFYIDDEVLQGAGITELLQYAVKPENANNLMPDFFLESEENMNKSGWGLNDGNVGKSKL